MKQTNLWVILGLASMIISSCSNYKTTDITREEEMIRNVLFQQQNDWNDGDIPSFMEGYHKSEELLFISSSGINQGWESTKERYQTAYPTKDKMGNLSFDIIDLKVFDDANAHLIGKYTLRNQQDSIFSSGYFTLLWQKINGDWRIVMDQTCG